MMERSRLRRARIGSHLQAALGLGVAFLAIAACTSSGGDSRPTGTSTPATVKEAAPSTVDSTTSSSSASTTTTAPEPIDGELVWTVSPDGIGKRTVVVHDADVTMETSAETVIDRSGNLAVSSSENGGRRIFQRVDIATGKVEATVTRPDGDQEFALSTSALLAADIHRTTIPAEGVKPARSVSELVLWDLADGTEMWRIEMGSVVEGESIRVYLHSVSPDAVVVVVNQAAKAFAVADGSLIWERPVGNYETLTVSPGGHWVTIGKLDTDLPIDRRHSFKVLESATGVIVGEPQIESSDNQSVSWAGPSTMVIPSTGVDGSALFVRVASDGLGELHSSPGTLATSTDGANSLVTNPDESIIILTQGGVVRGRDIVSGEQLWEHNAADRMLVVVAARGGKVIVNASGAGEDQAVVLDERTGEQMDVLQVPVWREITGHYSPGYFVWSGQEIGLTAFSDYSVYVWAVAEAPIGVTQDGNLLRL